MRLAKPITVVHSIGIRLQLRMPMRRVPFEHPHGFSVAQPTHPPDSTQHGERWSVGDAQIAYRTELGV